ncbi:MAG: hypothetical protein LC775_18015, partial [Acidobacteria bacterium]|nr:hypothetical protein [Acidobacteriota bacterium]
MDTSQSFTSAPTHLEVEYPLRLLCANLAPPVGKMQNSDGMQRLQERFYVVWDYICVAGKGTEGRVEGRCASLTDERLKLEAKCLDGGTAFGDIACCLDHAYKFGEAVRGELLAKLRGCV